VNEKGIGTPIPILDGDSRHARDSAMWLLPPTLLEDNAYPQIANSRQALDAFFGKLT